VATGAVDVDPPPVACSFSERKNVSAWPGPGANLGRVEICSAAVSRRPRCAILSVGSNKRPQRLCLGFIDFVG